MGIYDRFGKGVLVNFSTRKTIIYRFCPVVNITKIAYVWSRNEIQGRLISAIESPPRLFDDKDR